MKKFSILLVLLVFCSILKAGFVTFDCNFPDDPDNDYHTWSFKGYDSSENVIGTITEGDTTTDLSSAASWELVLAEDIYQLGYDQVVMSGSNPVDPTFHVAKSVTQISHQMPKKTKNKNFFCDNGQYVLKKA